MWVVVKFTKTRNVQREDERVGSMSASKCEGSKVLPDLQANLAAYPVVGAGVIHETRVEGNGKSVTLGMAVTGSSALLSGSLALVCRGQSHDICTHSGFLTREKP